MLARGRVWSLFAAIAGFLKDNSFESLKEAVSGCRFFDQPGYPNINLS
jgi:hypothetical protein